MTAQDREIMLEFSERMAKLEVAIVGNGTTGLGERMDDREMWEREHGANHADKRLDRKTIIALLAVGVTVTSTLFAGLTLLFSSLGWI